MTDQFAYTYPSPLEGYENLEPLPEYVTAQFNANKQKEKAQTDIVETVKETKTENLSRTPNMGC